MKIIDNRYKLDKFLKETSNGTVYIVRDLWNKEKESFLKIFHYNKHMPQIDYFASEFTNFYNVKHKYLLNSEEFNIIKYIDGEHININLYYYVTEFIDKPSLEEVCDKLSLQARLKIFQQLCTVLDFLHFKGIVYKHLSPKSIYIIKDNIKIKALAMVEDKFIDSDYDVSDRHFVSPEVFLRQDNIDYKADLYSLGMILDYLFPVTEENINDLSQLQIDFIANTINSLTRKDYTNRTGDLKYLITEINKYFSLDYSVDYKAEREKLNLNIPIVGRDNELNKIKQLDNYITSKNQTTRCLIVEGETGVGKTRFLYEICRNMELRGRDVYHVELKGKDSISFKSITNVLRHMINNAPKNLFQRYGCELVKIMPELLEVSGIKPSKELTKEKEIFRMYDRITNFIIDLSKENPLYIVIDNFNNSDNDTLRLLNYMLQNKKDAQFVLVISYNSDSLQDGKLEYDLIHDWILRGYAEEKKLSKLSLNEVGEMVQNILGINYKPLDFSTAILKETMGNPRYIELILQELYAMDKLRIENRKWNLMSINYSDIMMPPNIDDTITKQLKLLDTQVLQLLKVISVFNEPVAKNILFQMLNIEAEKTNDIVEKLVAMGLLDERVGDLGYSYTIHNLQLKRLLYDELSDEEKKTIHSQAVEILEREYSFENRGKIDELIYHLIQSNQRKKAIDYLIIQAKEMEPIISNQSIAIWDKVYKLIRDEKSELKLKVLLKIGKSYQVLGNNDKALQIYDEVLKESIDYEDLRYAIKSKIYRGEIFLRRNEIYEAEKEAIESKNMSKEVGYIDGLIESKILLIKVCISKDEIINGLKMANQALKLIEENNKVKFLGSIYNQMGIIFYLKGDMESAKEFYHKSIDRFQDIEEHIETVKPLNNLGNIYADYHDDEKRSREYYNRALEICNKYNYLDMELVLLSNIGESYVESFDYEKAREYIEKSRNIAIEMEDKVILFLANINLGQIYLIMGEYDNAYSCFKLVMEEYNKGSSFSKEILCQYYCFIGNLYYKFGKWEEARKYFILENKLAKDFHVGYYLMSKSKMLITSYFLEEKLDIELMEEVRSDYAKSALINDMAKVLTEFVFIAYLDGKYKYARELLYEIENISGLYYSKYLDYQRKALSYSMMEDEESINYLKDFEREVNSYEFCELEFFINYIIGDKYFAIRDYYQSINYYLESFNLMYRMVHKIPSEELQISYIQSHYGDKIKNRINKALKILFDIDVSSVIINDVIDGKSDLYNYFDFKNLLDLIGDDNFTKILGTDLLDNKMKNINGIEELISCLINDYEFNLNLILKYMAKETIAKRGVICYYDEDGELKVFAKLRDENSLLINESIINLVNKRETGVIIKNTFGNTKNNMFEELLPKDAKALICTPIIRPGYSLVETEFEDRRKDSHTKKRTIIGYIYLDTDRIFNRFDYERYRLIEILSYLVFLNIDNYKLKTISTMDKTTGTYTRKYFDMVFKELIEYTNRNNEYFSLLMIDIDKFKNINDTYGHRKGDLVLSIIGETLIKNTRATDIVARYGGEEFIIVLLNTKEEEAKNIAEKLRREIEKTCFFDLDYPLTISIGISLYPKHGQFTDELIEKADQALYNAKENGRNKVVLWKPDMGSSNVKRGDRLAGIITGNTIKDQRNLLAIMDVVNLNKSDKTIEQKIYDFLGRIIDVVDAEFGMLILLDDDNKHYIRKRFETSWVDRIKYNKKIIKNVIKDMRGEYLIDWDNIKDIDILTGTPSWQSLIVIPLIKFNSVVGVVYLSVPIEEKEFDYNCYNLVNVICDMFMSIL